MTRLNVVMVITGKDDTEIINETGWMPGEVKIYKKFVNNEWVKSQQKIDDRVVENFWSQVDLRGGDKRVDFLFFTQDMLYLIEVKDYYNIDDERLYILNRTMKTVWEQIGDYESELIKILQDEFPICKIVVLTNISRSGSNEKPALILREQVINNHNISIWFSEDVNRGNLEKLINQARKYAFGDDSLGKISMLCALMRIISDAFVEQIECSNTMSLKAFEQEQISIAYKLNHYGFRVIYGVAGSGKTVLLLAKAKQLGRLHQADRDWKMLIVCFNKPLQQYLSSQLSEYHAGIEIKTIHSWFRSLLQRWQNKEHRELLKIKNSGEYFEKLPLLVDNELNQGRKVTKYDVILVDEAQDFNKLWFEHLTKFYLNGSKSLFMIMIDGVQSIHSRDTNRFRWVDVGISASGRTKYLHKNYRNTKNIGEYALQRLGTLDPNTLDDDVKQFIEVKEFMREGGHVIQLRVKKSELNSMLRSLISVNNSVQVEMIIHNVYNPYTLLDLIRDNIADHFVDKLIVNC